MQVSSRPQGQASAPAADGPITAQDNTRRYVTFMVVAAWLILVLGKAFGLVSAEIDALLVGSVGAVFGYLYGKNEQITSLVEVLRNAGNVQSQEGRLS